jgi:hypothetical protein
LAVVVLEELEVLPLVDELVLAVDPAEEKGPELSLPQAARTRARPEAKIASQTRRADPTELEVMPCNALPSAQLKPMQKGQTQLRQHDGNGRCAARPATPLSHSFRKAEA